MSSNDSGGVTQDRLGSPPGPCAMVIFGAGGDLTKRKLMPALYNLAEGNLLPDAFAIVGVSIESYSSEQFRDLMTKDIREFGDVKVDPATWDNFVKKLHYVAGDFGDAGLYKKLGDKLAQIEKDQGTEGNVLFYMATAPSFFTQVVPKL
ncbi:MAG TPA: hypothetical protein VJR26_00865, partial [Candidatus Acidoferrales bacterium]|nr:hypothetical protein [Candidatus Acidoferrales bacterium]